MVWIRESFKERLTKMRVHITSIYGQSPRSIALISQKLVKDVGRQLGYDEMESTFIMIMLKRMVKEVLGWMVSLRD